MKFYLCSICNNLIEMIEDSSNNPSCCGKQMKELRTHSTDGALEKHVPVYKVTAGDATESLIKEVHVTVGELPHPSEDFHYIKWIILETTDGIYRKHLQPGDPPSAIFYIRMGEHVKNVYSYCNLHGLWDIN